MQESIEVRVTDITIMQLLDFPEPLVNQDKISHINKIFLAPELLQMARVTDKTDVYSVGVILYLLVTTGANENSLLQYSNEREVFKFDEPEWSDFSDDLKDFIRSCI